MPSDEDLSVWIAEWKEEYCPGALISIRYGDLGDLLGRTTYLRAGQIRRSEIVINDIFRDSTFTSYVVTWHEFAHAANWFDTGTGGHGAEWMRRWFRKPLLTLPAYLIIAGNVIVQFIRNMRKGV